jgi:hypothetical protein
MASVEVAKTLDGNPTTITTINGVRIVGECTPAFGNDPVRGTIRFYNDATGGTLLVSLLVDTPNDLVTGESGSEPNGIGFGPDNGAQIVDVHGVVFPAGATGGVHVDIGTYVTASQILHTSFCHFFGTATPTN